MTITQQDVMGTISVLTMILGLSACTDQSARQACMETSDCPPYQRCRLGFCADQPDCQNEDHCSEGYTCVLARCEPNSCQRDDQCENGICNRETNLCMPLAAGSCRDNTDCERGVCDPETRSCTIPVNPCGDGGCPPDSGTNTDCDEMTPCPDDSICDPNGQCQTDCRLQPEGCGQSDRCAAGTGLCVSGPCRSDEECEAQDHCHLSGACLPETCRRNQDCPENFACGIEPPLRSPLLQVCVFNEGRRVGFSSCTEDNDCASFLCTPRARCFHPCTSGADCDGGQCQEMRLNGDDEPNIIMAFTCEPARR